jgi:hypothetical protein
MSTSFPSRGKREGKSPRTADVDTLKEEFERKIAAVVFCLEEKAEENIDLSYKLKALQETSRQREIEKDRSIEDLLKSLKVKEEECIQLEKKVANDEVLNELNRRIQTITHCLNDMAEENLKLRTQVAVAQKPGSNGKSDQGEDSPPPVKGKSKQKRRSILRDFTWDSKHESVTNESSPKSEAGRPGSFPFSGSPFSPPPANSSSFSMDTDVPSSASILSGLAASSLILSTKQGTNSAPSTPTPTTPTPSTPTSTTPAAPTVATPVASDAKAAPATTNVSTNTSPVPTPPTTPNARALAVK